ncbi:NAD(P)H-binding protein [Streptomyces mesophilus]|uniref:NAD(P)H-binding protein n=1 Tax=Streptomyces mesophilus TaxID=1775132 RepID=UPI00331A8D38
MSVTASLSTSLSTSIAITGATGNVGRALVETLSAGGGHLTATARGIADAHLPENVRALPSDLTDPETLRPVLEGNDALFLQSGGPSAFLIDPPRLLDTVKRSGVRRVVLLSSQGVATRPESASHGRTARVIEDAVRESGLDWTILRPGGFASNAFAWADSVRTRREIAAPFAGVGLPVIDPADIAEVAAVALREPGHNEAVYELTGPELITPRDQAEAIARALGEPVRFTEQTRAEARAQMLHFLPEPVADTTLSILGTPTEAEQRISSAVAQVTGRPARTFADWASRNIAAFR